MKLLVNILIIFFIILLFYQIYIQNFGAGLLEGLENVPTYQPYDLNNPNNTLILAQQNAGNIDVLKKQIDELQGMKKEVNDISLNLISVNQQIQGLIQQQQQAATEIYGNKPLTISGTSSA